MYSRPAILGLILLSVSGFAAAEAAQQIPLVVPAGTPLRLYLAKRVPMREGASVEATVLDPVYSFDRQVIPPGAVVRGHVARVRPVSKAARLRAILGGDLTPLHTAPVEFTTLVMPDGRTVPLKTADTLGLNSIYSPRLPKKQNAPSQPQNSGVLGTGKQKVQEPLQSQIDRARSISELLRGPDKKERAEDYLISKLPYHPQYVRKGTRFDVELTESLSFGSEPVLAGSLAQIGTQPPADTVAHARLITPLDSASSRQGDRVEAVLAEPVYSTDHHLILPEGAVLEGTVVVARSARWFHRSGQLRFNFHAIVVPQEVIRLQEKASHAPVDAAQRPAQQELKIRTEANLQAAEGTGKTPLKVDGEGGVQTKESKTRFLAAAAAVMVARRAGDNDAIRNQSHQVMLAPIRQPRAVHRPSNS